MGLYAPPRAPTHALVNGMVAARADVQSFSSTPPLAEMIKSGEIRCLTSLVIEPLRLQDSNTGQQFAVSVPVVTSEGVKQVEALVTNVGEGQLGLVVESPSQVAFADELTAQASSQSSTQQQTQQTVAAAAPGPGQYEAEVVEQGSFYYEGPNTALGASYQAQYTPISETPVYVPQAPTQGDVFGTTPTPIEPETFFPGSHVPLPPEYGGSYYDPVYGELGGSLGF